MTASLDRPTFVQPDEMDISRQTGAGVRVAVVDSGVDNTHPKIDGRIRGGAVVQRWEDYLVVGDYDGKDLFGHGTAVASLVLDIAPEAEVHSVRVLGSDLGSKSEIIIHGLKWCLKQGFDVINCSFGTTNLSYLEPYKAVIDEAYCRGVILTAACNNHDFTIDELPSSFPSLIAVDYFRGDLDDPLRFFRREGYLIEFVARGDNLRVAWLDHKFITSAGSSFATPCMTGVICRLLQKYPQLKPFEIKTLLYHMAEQLPAGQPGAAGRAGG